jgi:hypothetical protein
MHGKSMMVIEPMLRDGQTKMKVHLTNQLLKLMVEEVETNKQHQLPVEDQELALNLKPILDLKLEADQAHQTVDITLEIPETTFLVQVQPQSLLLNNNNNKTAAPLL